ncbi:hypothetical protein B0T18DRAFT_390457 [Schizothecium vesticola]|uniref:Uncharacterized protein n=1 Tax=Schizothecium vesticola TaxID=314040 RepID=A0AA40K554_9PEZI|nr:hypothetical protein B0T18DRAFT_390457 [Schizothecium vesticola]
MDQARKPKRSSSDGSLRRTYSSQSLPQQRPGPSHPFLRPPLRSVTENPLLVSPGPLESMLKKTTETGDIGIFSIRPPRPPTAYHAPATHHAPPRSRSVFAEPSVPRPAIRVSGGDPIWRDDRRRLPSYRDTASEIISMYGSDSQRSVSSSLSMPFDEPGRRSYSMTSCSSRPLPHQRSNGTLQSQASGSLLQRPRSPFPYPTRLKRPGVRPSSPAVTENGRVDYSRMVGIDRVSSRTVHGSHKPSPTPHGRRLAPRYGCLDAYNAGRSSSRYESSSASQYSQGSLSAAPGRHAGRHNGGFGVSMPEQSRRTPSLAPVADMYRSPSSSQSIRSCPLVPRASSAFYYDYSEDFEDRPSPVTSRPPPPRAPLAPIPTRVPSAHRASILNDGFDSCFEVPSERDLALTRQHHSLVKPYQDQVDPGDRHFSPRPPPYRVSSDGHERRLCLLPKNYQNSFGVPNVERSRPLRREICDQPTSHQQGHGGRRNERSSREKTVAELFGSEDYEQENYPIPNGRPRMLQEDSNMSKEGSSAPSPEHISLRALHSAYPETRPLSALTCHSNKSKVCSIEAGLADLASFVPFLDKACEWSDEDNVNKSTPQAGSDTDLGRDAPPHDVPRGEDHIPDGPNSGSKNESHVNSPVIGHGPAHLGRDGTRANDRERNNQRELIDAASPDFLCDTRPRVRPPDHTVPSVPERTSSEHYHSLRPSNGRLRLRVSRAALNKTYTRSHPNRGQCDGPESAQTSASFDRDSNLTGAQGPRNQGGRDGNLLEIHDQRLSFAAEETKAPSLNGSAVLGNFRTSLSGRISTSMQPGRGLKKRVSELCMRLAGSSIRSSKGDGASSDTESFPRLLRDTIHEKIEEDPSQPNTFPRQLGRFRGRGSRWLRAARHAVMVACAGSRKH